jgi:hypothetical protein
MATDTEAAMATARKRAAEKRAKSLIPTTDINH